MDGVRVDDDDGVRTMTLDRPARLNAVTASSVFGLVGESGSGKSVTWLAVTGLTRTPAARSSGAR
jgi:ABC-type microcin C transport system duplicated ATPase subunit YejF